MRQPCDFKGDIVEICEKIRIFVNYCSNDSSI